jgi:outer membrane protein assembly factor BamB
MLMDHDYISHRATLVGSRISALGVPNPERRRPHSSLFPKANTQRPLLRDASAPHRCKTALEAARMKSPICVTNICVTSRKQTASLSIAGLMLTIASLWLMLAAANTSAHAQTSSTPSPADWTQFLRNNMERWNPYETVLGVNNVSGLKLKWAFSTGSFVSSSPAIVDGVVYIGSDDDLYALNASTGAELWSYPTGSQVYASPAVANGVVYIGSNDGTMYALKASTGAKLWSYAAGTTVLSSPAVANGTVYGQSVSSVSGNLYAFGLNASTGALLWSYTLGDRPFDAPESSPAVTNGVVYIGGNNTLYALNASTGAKLWSYDTGFPVESSPVVANGVVYISIGFGTAVYALNASSGALLWSYALGNIFFPRLQWRTG